jgi:hypothetical protein
MFGTTHYVAALIRRRLNKGNKMNYFHRSNRRSYQYPKLRTSSAAGGMQSKNTGVLIVTGLLLAILIAIGGYMIMRGHSNPNITTPQSRQASEPR